MKKLCISWLLFGPWGGGYNREGTSYSCLQQSTTYTITTQQKGGLQYTLPLWRPFGHSLGVLGAGNPP